MRSIQKREAAELDCLEFDSLLAQIDAGDVIPASFVPFDEAFDEADPDTRRRYRMREFVAKPGCQDAICPHCGLGGGVVDSQGFFTCERCDYYNWAATEDELLARESDPEDAACLMAASVGATADRRALDVDSYFDSVDAEDGLSSETSAELHADELKLIEAA
jgi:hypothetical protein